MARAFKGSTFKLKKIETAYDSLRDLSWYELSDKIENMMAKEGYVPKLIRNKWKFVYKG